MGNEFSIYFELGLRHLLDSEAIDHILFIVALCVPYKYKQWKKILVLATAFTIGHTVTLALYTLDYIDVNSKLIEILIPITILITIFINVFRMNKTKSNLDWNYTLAIGFGLIHGLGFANFFKAMIGSSDGIGLPLFYFNLGIELGQISIIAFIFLIQSFLLYFIKFSGYHWNIILNTIVGLLSIKLLIEQLIQ